MIKKCFVAILALALAAVSTAQIASQQRVAVPVPLVSTDSLMKHIVELSSETYEGRLAGSRGFDAAVAYVERVLARYGVDFTQKDMAHRFETECNQVENCKFNVYRPGTKERDVFTLGNEFCCAGMTGRGYVDAQMVFVGYGIAEDDYDEYRSVDVQGKIVIVLTGLPEQSKLPGRVLQGYQTLRDKARVAQRHGALGMLAVNMSQSCLPFEPQGKVYNGELPHLTTFPILHLTRDCAARIMESEQAPLDSAAARINRLRQPQSFSLRQKAEVDVNAIYNQRALTSNAVGVLPGCDRKLRDEYIVVGAALDGAGMQGETCLFPGADINASGVAAVLEIARLLSDPRYRPRRSVVFALFSASEQQYLGSRVMVSNFHPLRHIEAFVDVQNIGSGDSLAVLGGARYPTLAQVAYNYDTTATHAIRTDLPASDPRGDAVAFDAVDIPSLVVTTTGGMQHNHVSSDIWENIDRRILSLGAQLALGTVCNLGEGLYQGRSPQSRAWRW